MQPQPVAAKRYAIPTRHKVFVGGLPDVGDDALVAYFSQFGAVADAIAMRKDGKPRGFGFVTFSSPEVYHKVLALEHAIDGKTLALKPADGNDRRDAASQPQQMWPQQQLQPQQLMQPQQMHPPQMQMQPMQPELPESQMHMLQQMQWQQMQQLQAQQLQLQPPQQLQQLQPQPQQLQPRYE